MYDVPYVIGICLATVLVSMRKVEGVDEEALRAALVQQFLDVAHERVPVMIFIVTLFLIYLFIRRPIKLRKRFLQHEVGDMSGDLEQRFLRLERTVTDLWDVLRAADQVNDAIAGR